ncbi:XdhC family protein [Guyparkeria hydrothermalis]|uniref:XdhC family protein n=1 Tax=Guyparkeria hydrothermalis TaxID=923 RepID=UPI002021C917|nr:XdhC family protein [Guyparkeria hydrothermalis]MCL7745146.1 XdhC family protein [Guyparkeria hydrothermalis]
MTAALPSSDREAALRLAVDGLAAGREVALVTVLSTYGSAPRRPGSIWVVVDPPAPRPRMQGSISGGCIEEDLLDWLAQRARRGQSRAPVIRSYDGSDHHGLPCGGTLSVLVEWLRGPEDIEPALAAISRRQAVWREVDLSSGVVGWRPAASLLPESPTRDERKLAVPFGPAWRLVIVGSGPVADQLGPQALALGFEVIVCDPRASAQPVPAGTMLSQEAPERLFARLGLDERTAVVAVAHDPRLDDLALIDALESPAFHVAVMGGVGTSRARRDRLASLGVDTSRLRAPAGLDIGSHTPAEIAVSIAAELVAARSLARRPGKGAPLAPVARAALDAD